MDMILYGKRKKEERDKLSRENAEREVIDQWHTGDAKEQLESIQQRVEEL